MAWVHGPEEAIDELGARVLRIQGNRFVDELGRSVHLRGVNLSGSSKVPARPDGSTWNPDSLTNPAAVSFVGRPFPIDEADEHFARLKAWGLTFIRFLVTWEAIEHEGPGRYDEAYLDYVRTVAVKAAEHGLTLFIDPHQDVWSRFSGGDGAPAWTFEILGMDAAKFDETGAAVTHQRHAEPLPPMLWLSNYWKYACATMWTLFFGGDQFAPKTRIDGIPVQEFLQGHYIAAIQQLARRLADLPHVVGYDTLNEPSQGYIGYPDLNHLGGGLAAYGLLPTFFQGMALAAGIPQDVRHQASGLFPFSKTVRANPLGTSLWKPGVEPIWRKHGVWEIRGGKPVLARRDYFFSAAGRPVNFDRDFLSPFLERYCRAIRSVHPGAWIFVSTPPPELRVGPEGLTLRDTSGLVFAPHFYDSLTLGLQRYVPWIGAELRGRIPRVVLGRRRRRRLIARQIARLVDRARTELGGAPTVFGEVGVPFNLNAARAYRDGDFSAQSKAMDDSIQGMETNLVGFTLWNYTPDNTNARGDQWNGEDLSIYSRDQRGNAGGEHDDGGRGLDAVIRPYVMKTPGRLLSAGFDLRTRTFRCQFENDSSVRAPLEVFLPRLHYGRGVSVEATAGRVEIETGVQVLRYYPNEETAVHTLVLSRRE